MMSAGDCVDWAAAGRGGAAVGLAVTACFHADYCCIGQLAAGAVGLGAAN